MKNTVAVLIISGFVASIAVTVAAQATRSVNEGVYTADQAKRGEALYKEQCSACHGDNLEGSGPMSQLAGKDFLANWTGKSLGDLYEKTQTTMPATAPGTLTPEQAADVVSYLLSKDNYPSSTLPSKSHLVGPVLLDRPSIVGRATRRGRLQAAFRAYSQPRPPRGICVLQTPCDQFSSTFRWFRNGRSPVHSSRRDVPRRRRD